MFGGSEPQGFTIVEILIFLSVSGLLFLSVLNLINNDQNKTDFTQGTHEFYSQIQDLTNNVQIGYYASDGNISCTYPETAPPTTPTVTNVSGNNKQGQSYGCTFIGRVLLFAPTGNTSQYVVDTIVGRQFVSGSSDSALVSNLTAANPYALAQGTDTSRGLETVNLPPGLKIAQVTYKDTAFDGGLPQYDNLIAFLSSFPSYSSANILSGSLSSSLLPVPSNVIPASPSGSSMAPGQLANYVASAENDGTNKNVYSSSNTPNLGCSNTTGTAPPCTVLDPNGGVAICLQSTGLANDYAIITIGGNSAAGGGSNPLSTQLTIYSGNQCP